MLPLASFKVKKLLLWDIVLKTVYLLTPFFLGESGKLVLQNHFVPLHVLWGSCVI